MESPWKTLLGQLGHGAPAGAVKRHARRPQAEHACLASTPQGRHSPRTERGPAPRQRSPRSCSLSHWTLLFFRVCAGQSCFGRAAPRAGWCRIGISTQGERGGVRELLTIFQRVEDPRRGNAKRHDLHEVLLIALLSTLAGGRAGVGVEGLADASRSGGCGLFGAQERDSEPRRVLASVQTVEPSESSDNAAALGAGLGGPARRSGRGERQGAEAVVRGASGRS